MSHGADQNAVIVKAVQDNLSESKQEIHGSDSNGKKYKTITAMWLSQGVLQKASSSKRSNSEDEIKNDEVGLCKS
eukprot:2646060-Ditylum_brightwellii.AAC.1